MPQILYPGLPPLDTPAVQVEPFVFDWPRKPDGSVDKQSNVYIGLTEENFKGLLLTLKGLYGAIDARDARLAEVNKQREAWRTRNAVQKPKEGAAVISP